MPSIVRCACHRRSASVIQLVTFARLIRPYPRSPPGVADTRAAAEARARKAQHLVQHVNHHHANRHVQCAVHRAVHCECQGARWNANDTDFRIFSAVTDVWRKRCPVTWAIALTRADMIGIIATSAIPSADRFPTAPAPLQSAAILLRRWRVGYNSDRSSRCRCRAHPRKAAVLTKYGADTHGPRRPGPGERQFGHKPVAACKDVVRK
jgi:hypothetical protein